MIMMGSGVPEQVLLRPGEVKSSCLCASREATNTGSRPLRLFVACRGTSPAMERHPPGLRPYTSQRCCLFRQSLNSRTTPCAHRPSRGNRGRRSRARRRRVLAASPVERLKTLYADSPGVKRRVSPWPPPDRTRSLARRQVAHPSRTRGPTPMPRRPAATNRYSAAWLNHSKALTITSSGSKGM